MKQTSCWFRWVQLSRGWVTWSVQVAAHRWLLKKQHLRWTTARAWRGKMSPDDNPFTTETAPDWTPARMKWLYRYQNNLNPKLNPYRLKIKDLPYKPKTHTQAVTEPCWCTVVGAGRCFMSELLFTLSGFHFHLNRDRVHSFLSVLTHLTAARSRGEKQEGTVDLQSSCSLTSTFFVLSFLPCWWSGFRDGSAGRLAASLLCWDMNT